MPLPRVAKQRSVDPGFSSKANPFDSDSEGETNARPGRASSVPPISKTNPKVSPFGDTEDLGRGPSSSYSVSNATKNQYKNDFRDSGGFENQSVQELENYAAYKAEETTHKVNDCLKIAEVIKEDATKTLVTLHQQGEQITRTHHTAADIEHDLSRSEKLLGSLGGIFSKPWKPKKTRQIKGPAITRDDSFIRKANHTEQREKLGLSLSPRGRSNPRQYAEPTSAMDKVQIEKAKQDDSLGDLSNVLGQLKDMALDMGTEIERQNKALDALHDDVDELNFRVKGANQRGRRLLGK
ncbi:SNAP25 homologous protein SNAP33-like [Ananas comosus]|uniref:SNAP25 homologous protein SNAP33-like n=1 Tax=Ananas comosus TaxID=4615 RepID=A0A199URT6_ANACO|nr:SNAP25 homologous protein SNAP33-like [Ananas comosus]OAY67513.1 SNAPous protein SNAP33 [Ananas comosus]